MDQPRRARTAEVGSDARTSFLMKKGELGKVLREGRGVLGPVRGLRRERELVAGERRTRRPSEEPRS